MAAVETFAEFSLRCQDKVCLAPNTPMEAQRRYEAALNRLSKLLNPLRYNNNNNNNTTHSPASSKAVFQVDFAFPLRLTLILLNRYLPLGHRNSLKGLRIDNAMYAPEHSPPFAGFLKSLPEASSITVEALLINLYRTHAFTFFKSSVSFPRIDLLYGFIGSPACRIGTLDWGYMEIPDVGAFSAALEQNASIRSLILERASGLGSEGLLHLVCALRHCPQLRSLDLKRIPLLAGTPTFASLTSALLHLSSLRSLHFPSIYPPSSASAPIRPFPAFLLSRALKILDFSTSVIGEAIIRSVSEHISGPECLLEILDLSHVAVAPRFETDPLSLAAFVPLATALSLNHCRLASLSLAGRPISEDGLPAPFFRLLLSHTSLRSLSLRCCGISARSLYRLSLLGSPALQLTQLDLQENRLGQNGAEFLLDQLLTNAALTRLSLSQNHVHNPKTLQAIRSVCQRNQLNSLAKEITLFSLCYKRSTRFIRTTF